MTADRARLFIPDEVAAAFVRDLTDVTRRYGIVIRSWETLYAEHLEAGAEGGYVLNHRGVESVPHELAWQENGPGLSRGWRKLDETTAEGYSHAESIEAEEPPPITADRELPAAAVKRVAIFETNIPLAHAHIRKFLAIIEECGLRIVPANPTVQMERAALEAISARPTGMAVLRAGIAAAPPLAELLEGDDAG